MHPPLRRTAAHPRGERAHRERVHSAAVAAALTLSLAACNTVGTRARAEAPTSVREAMLAEAARQHAVPAQRGPFDETFGLRLGGAAFGQFRTEASLGVVDTSVGTKVDFEDEFGLAGQQQTFRADAWYRFGRNHRIDAAWFSLDRAGTRTINRDITWGDITFPINTSVEGQLDTTILQVRYTWNFLTGEDYEVGAGLGIYGMDVRAALRAESLGLEREFSSPVPLPVVSVQGAWEFSPGWQLLGSAQVFFLKLEGISETDEMSGSVVDAQLGVEYQLTDNAGIGISIDYFNVGFGAVRDQLDFDFDYGYTAGFLYLTLKI